jgi:FMN phosphatase YigB (HAD superfamily)
MSLLIYNKFTGRYLLEQLRLPGEEVVFLDDIGANLSAARKIGITTIKVSDIQAAIGELQVRLL